MAEREEQTILKAGGAKAAAKAEEEEESSASEYEEIIEEVTDDSDEEEEEQQQQQQQQQQQEVKQAVEKQLETKSSTSTSTSSKLVEQKLAKVELSKEVTVVDGQQGESLPQKPEAQPATAKGTATAELGAAKAAAKATATAELGTTLSNSVSNKLSHSSQHSISQKSASVVVVSPKLTKTDTNTMQPQQQVKRLSVPQKEDSGTESGEDLRLLAAGLRDTLQQRSGNDANDRGLLEEVTDALSRLECSLKLGQELAVDGGQRQALLSLIARLQSGLSATGLPVESNVTATDERDEHDERCEPSESCNLRQRFAKRRQRNSRHTVGVSREELADARRYMEDMLMLHPPQTSVQAPNQTVTVERVASSSAIVGAPSTQLYRPNQFVPQNKVQLKPHNNHNNHNNNRRPLSGDYGISLASYEAHNQATHVVESPRFNGTKKQLMKRANTIDIPKAKAKYSTADCDTDSELEERHGPEANLGLKRAVQVSVKRRVQHVVPPFEPKTENDHKFLAFINRQSHQGGLGWAGARSVSNWTHKFGNIKHTFETGVAATATKGKPPQPPVHHYQQQQQLQQQAHLERQRRQELERQLRLEQEARLEREYYEQQLERQHLERQQQLERQRQQQEQLERQRRQEMELRMQQQREREREREREEQPLNQFIHAPQSVFRPIEQGQANAPNIYKPIAQKTAITAASGRGKLPSAPPQTHLQAPPSYSQTPSPASSPIGLPWVAKPRVDNSDFKRKAHHFEERSLRDNLEQQQQQPPSGGYVQRHNSLRSKAAPLTEFKKRPSLPNAMQPEVQLPYAAAPPPPPPTNISFTYADYAPATTRRIASNLSNNYRSQPCLSSVALEPLTNPLAAPLVLTSANPTYLPTHYDFVSPIDSPTSCLTAPNTDDDLDLDSDHNMHEYRAEIKVMRKPRSQTAVTVAGRRTAHVSDDEVFGRNSRAAKSLLYTMKQLGGNGNGNGAVKPTLRAGVPALVQPSSPSKPACLSPDGRLYQAPLVEPLFPQLNSFEANRQPQYQAAVPLPVPSQPSQPSEAQTSYVVTYPLDDSADEQESSVSLSRMRRSSEHSNASSSLSMTSWTANPMHVQQAAPPPPPPVDRSNKPQLAPKPQQPHPRLSTRSHTISESMSTETAAALPTLPALPALPALQQRVMSQQQQQQELRRKSLGNVLEQQHKLYYEQQEYKSSAPSDTPDIVKSSLPKEQAPLLKKFGPPQRHHYVPNAYQSPQLSKQSSQSSSNIQQQQQHKPIVVETPATPQPQQQPPANVEQTPEEQIPRNIVFNNVNAFSSLSRRQHHHEEEELLLHHQSNNVAAGGSRMNRLSKCDSWTQICRQQPQQQLSNGTAAIRYNQPSVVGGAGGELRRTKSGHSLAVPKLYEAGIAKEQVGQKQRTVAAYFSGQKSPTATNGQFEELRTTTTTTSQRKSAINRTKTSEKLSAARKSLSSLNSISNSNGNVSTAGLYRVAGGGGVTTTAAGGGGLSRSATMPHIAHLNLLDESNVEDAFEQLMLGA